MAVDTLYDSVIRWSRFRGVAAFIASILTIVSGVHVVARDHPIAEGAIGLADAIAVASMLAGVMLFVLELSARNQLGRLFRLYE